MRGTLPNSSAPKLLHSDSWCNQTEANVIREVFTTPPVRIPGLEAWFQERDLLIVVSDENYQERKLSLIG